MCLHFSVLVHYIIFLKLIKKQTMEDMDDVVFFIIFAAPLHETLGFSY